MAKFDERFLRQLESLTLIARQARSGQWQGERRSPKRGQSVEFADYRTYVPGDDFRLVDWNAYARLERFFLKLFVEEEDLTVHLLIDTSRSMDWPPDSAGQPSHKLSYACRAAAALGYIALAGLDRVTVSAVGGMVGTPPVGSGSHFPPRRGRQQAFALFDFLAGLAADGATSLSQSFTHYAAQARQPGPLLIFSDLFDSLTQSTSAPPWANGLTALLARRFEVSLIHLLSPDEAEPALSGDLRLVDSETGQAVEVTADYEALARPATQARGVTGQTVVLILDTSASMAATDVDNGASTRLEAAQAAAHDLVTNLPTEARVTVIAAAGGEAETLASASQDRRQVLAAIDAAEVTAQGSDLQPAVGLAEAIVAREPAAEIVLFSDGVVQVPERLVAPVRFWPVGQSGANQAVSALSVTPSAGGEPELFVQVSNYTDEASQRRLVVQVDGLPVTAFDLEIPANGHVERWVEALPSSAQTVEAYLAPAEHDFLSLDDRAWVVLQPGGPLRTTLVTRGNFFLQTALSLLSSQRIGPNLELTTISPEDWPASEPAENPASLHIFDAYIPDNLPAGNLLLLAPPRSAAGLFELSGQEVNPIPRPVLTDHPLLQHVELAETQILTTAVLSATPWSQVVVAGETPAGDQAPLLLAGEIAGRRVAILAFSLQQSDLPLQPTFPILVANLINYLAPGVSGLVPGELAPGDTLPKVSLPPGVSGLRLIPPTGPELSLAGQAGRVSLPPLEQPGLYQLIFEQPGAAGVALDPTRFAVNFFDPLESAIRPQPDLTLAGQAGQGTVSSPRPPAQQEWWRPVAMVALALLVMEWLVYQRSAVLKWWNILRWRTAGSK